MNRALFFCALCVPALALTTPGRAQDDDHYYSMVSVDKTTAQFADDNAQRTADGSIRISMLKVPDSGPIAYTINQVTLNCASLKYQFISEVDHTSDGRQIAQQGDAQSTPIKPNTVGDELKRYICDGIDPYPRSKSIKGMTTAISKAHDLIAVEKKK